MKTNKVYLLLLLLGFVLLTMSTTVIVHADDDDDDDDKKKKDKKGKKDKKDNKKLCRKQPLNYTGTYLTSATTMSYDQTTQTVSGTEKETLTVVISPGIAGPTSYVMSKFTDPTTRNLTDAVSLAQAEAESDPGVDALCFAPAPIYGGKGIMNCVDTLDAGQTIIIPDEVNDECEVVTLHFTYTETATVGCTSSTCMGLIAHGNSTRVNEQ